MAARNRNRPGVVKEEADEERALWQQVRGDGKRVDALVVSIRPMLYKFSFNGHHAQCQEDGTLHFQYPSSYPHITIHLLYYPTHDVDCLTQEEHNQKWTRMQDIKGLLDSEFGTYDSRPPRPLHLAARHVLQAGWTFVLTITFAQHVMRRLLKISKTS